MKRKKIVEKLGISFNQGNNCPRGYHGQDYPILSNADGDKDGESTSDPAKLCAFTGYRFSI
jgi:hypothetical protein